MGGGVGTSVYVCVFIEENPQCVGRVNSTKWNVVVSGHFLNGFLRRTAGNVYVIEFICG